MRPTASQFFIADYATDEKFYDVAVMSDPDSISTGFDATKSFKFVVMSDDHIYVIQATKANAETVGSYSLNVVNYYQLGWDTSYSIDESRGHKLVYYALNSSIDQIYMIRPVNMELNGQK